MRLPLALVLVLAVVLVYLIVGLVIPEWDLFPPIGRTIINFT